MRFFFLYISDQSDRVHFPNQSSAPDHVKLKLMEEKVLFCPWMNRDRAASEVHRRTERLPEEFQLQPFHRLHLNVFSSCYILQAPSNQVFCFASFCSFKRFSNLPPLYYFHCCTYINVPTAGSIKFFFCFFFKAAQRNLCRASKDVQWKLTLKH